MGLPRWLRESACQYRRPGFNPCVGKIPGEGKGYILQYSLLENSMDCIVHEVTKSQTQLSTRPHKVAKSGPDCNPGPEVLNL